MYPKFLLAFISAGQTSGRLQLTPSSRPLISERRGRTATRRLHKDNFVNGIIQGSIARNGLNKFRLAVQWNAEISVPKLPGYQHAHDLFGAFVKLPHELHINLDHIDYSGAGKTPNTGDENNLSMWFSLLIATAAAAVWLAAIRKQKMNDR